MADPNFSSLLAQKQANVASASEQKQAAIDPQAFAAKNILQQYATGTTPLQQQIAAIGQPTAPQPIGYDMAPSAAPQQPATLGTFLNEQAQLRRSNLVDRPYQPDEVANDLGSSLMSGTATTIGMAGQTVPTAITSIGAGVNNIDSIIKSALAPSVSPEDRALGLGAPERGTAGNDILQMGIGAQKRIQAAVDYLAAPYKAAVTEKGSAKADRFAADQQAARDAEDAAYRARQAEGQNGVLNDLQDAGASLVRGFSDYANNPIQAARATAENLPQLALSVGLGGTSLLGNAAVSGTLEASGMYQQVKEQMDKTSDAELMQNSAQARQLSDAGYNMSDIRDIILGQAVGEAAPLQFGAATLAAPLGGKLETGLAGRGFGNTVGERFRSRAAALGGEFADEFLNSATGGLAANAAIQNNVDGSQRVLQDVGEQAIQGGLVGVGMGATASVPGLARDTVIAAGQGLASAGRQALSGLDTLAQNRRTNNADNASAEADTAAASANFGDAVNTFDPNVGKQNAETPIQETQDESSSPVADSVSATVPDVNATADVVNAPVDETTLSNVFSEQGQQAIRDIDAGKGNAAQKLGGVMQVLDNTPDMQPEVRRAMEIYANDKLNALVEHRDAINNALEQGQVDAQPELKVRLESQRDAINTIVNNPTAQKLLNVYDENNLSQEDFDTAIQSLPADITPENVNTPEVQNAFAAIKEQSVANPLTVTGDQYRQVLNHDTSLSPLQRTVMEAKAKIADFLANHETVSNNIRNDSREEFQSVRDHAKNIFKAMSQKDTAGIQKNLDGLRDFAEKQINRFNAHDSRMADVIRTGLYDDNAYTNVPGYYQLDANGKRSKTKLQFVNPSAKGKANLRAIADDTNHIVDVYNALASTVPGANTAQLAPVTPTWTQVVPNSATAAEKTVFAEQSGKAPSAPVEEAALAPVTNGLTAEENTRLNELAGRSNKLSAAEKTEVSDLLTKQRDAILGEPDAEVTPVPDVVNADTEVAPVTEPDNTAPVQRDESGSAARESEPVETVAEPSNTGSRETVPNVEPATNEQPALTEEPVQESSVGKAVLDAIPLGGAALADASNAAERSARTNQLKATFQPATPSNYQPRIMSEATPEEMAQVTGYAITDTMQKGLGVFQIGMRTIAGQLNKALKAAATKHKVVEKVDTASPAFALANLKSLYATQVTDGKVQYIPEFLETMSMAGMHWVTSSQPASMDIDRLAKLIGRPASYLASNPQLLNTLLNSGSPVTSVANQMAGMIERLLGIKERTDTSRTYGRTIIDSLAREVLEAMDTAGIVKITSVPIEGTDTVMNMVRPVMDDTLRDLKSDLGPAVDIVQDFLLPKDSKGFTLGESSNPVAKTVNGDTWQQVPAQVQTFIKAQQDVPWKLNKNFYDMQSMLGDKTGFGALVAAGYYDGDLTLLNDAHRAVVESKNLGLVNGSKAADDMVARLDASADGRDTNIHWKYTMDTNGRTRMDSAYNPQSNKVMREIFNSTNVEVNTNNPQQMREWYLHLAQGLGVKVDKMANDDAIASVQTILETDTNVGTAIAALQNGLENGWEAVTKAEADSIVDAVRGKDNKYLHTLLSAATGQLALENGDNTFEHAVTFEVDGVTDGPGNAYVHFGMTDVTPGSLDILKKIGWNVNTPDTPSNKTHGETPDMYVTSAANIFNAMLQGSPTMSLLNYAGQTVLEDENIATGLTRSFAKIVVTPATYGAGIVSMSATVTDSVVNALYKHLSDVLSGNDTLNKPMLAALDELAGTSEFSDIANGSDQALKTFVVSEPVRKSLDEAIFNDIGEAIFQGINQTVGGALMNNKELSALADIQGHLFNEAWKNEYNRLRDELVAKGELAPNEMLSARDENKVTKATEHLAPIYQNGITGNDRANGFNMGTMDKNGKTDYLPDPVTNKAVAVTMSAKLKATGRGTELTSPGVRTAALSTIGGGDATMMVKGGKKLFADKLVANNVFDGLDTRVGEMEQASDIINGAVAEGWSENIYQNIVSGAAAVLKDADLNTLGEAAFKSVYSAIAGSNTNFMTDKERRNNIPKLKAAIDQMVAKHQNNALRNSYVRQALLEAKSTISHMGGVDKAFNYGSVEYTGTPEEVVMALKARVAELAAADKNAPKITSEAGLVEKLNQYGTTEDGLTVLTKDQLMTALSTFDFGGNRITRELFKRLAPVLSSDLTVYHGDASTISQLQAKMHPDVAFSPSANATTYGNNIFLINATSETMLHEAIHAGIQNSVNQFYANPEAMVPEQRSAVSNMEKLMNQFLKMDKQNTDYATAVDINYARNNIESYLNQGNQAAGLNEFVAWSLANQNLQDFFGSRTAEKGAQVKSAFADIIGKLKNAILKLMGIPVNRGQSVLEAMAGNFDNLVTQIAEVQSLNSPYAQADIQQLNQALNHQGNTTHADYIEALVTRLNAATKTNIKQFGELLAQNAMDRTLIQGDAPKINQAVKAFQSAGWVMSPKEQHAFQLMQAVLVSNIQLNPTAMNAMQRMYDTVMPTLTTADLTQTQLDALNGKSTVFTDAHGRSTHLANFIALGATNEAFRNALARRDIPRRENDTGDLFKKMAKATRDSIDFLADVGNGTRTQKNARQAFDVLADKISTINMTTKANMADEATNLIGKGDNLIYKQFERVAKKAGDARDERVIAGKNSTLLDQGVNAVLSAIELLDKNSAGLDTLQSAINSSKMWQPAKELFTEMLGTSKSSMVINKMLQQAKNQVSAVRQKIRETVPKNVASKFTRELTESEWSAVTQAFGKTDVQALLTSYTMDDVKNWLADTTKLDAEVSTVESQVSGLQHGSDYVVRAKELAHYMMTGDNISDHLLRNATAISQLVGSGKTIANSDAAVAPIDKLVSLYALQMVEEGNRTAVSSLLDTERSGMDFVGTYLTALNNIEQTKMANYNALNGHKGTTPVLDSAHKQLVVATAKDGRNLVENFGFVKVPGYVTDKDLGANQLSYYYTNENLTAGYTQGALQTVEPLLHGVDPVTGQTTALRGSYGLSHGAAKAMARQKAARITTAKLGTEGGKLMPIFNENGEITGYEAPIPDAVRYEKMDTNTQMHELMGVTQGRQAEETLAQAFNQALADKLAKVWDADKGGMRKNEYIDLAKSAKTNKVHAQTWAAIPRSAQEMLAKSFGGPVMVREDMLNNAFGYRNFSVSSLFVNQSELPAPLQGGLVNVATAILGPKAPKIMRTAGRYTQDAVSIAKDWVIVRSVTVFTMNLMGNFIQLGQAGVPISQIFKGQAAKMQEVDAYLRNVNKINNLHSDNLGLTDVNQKKKNVMAMQRLLDANARMSIAPLIAAGELPTVAEGLSIEDDNAIRGGALNWMDRVIDKLPKGASDAVKLAMIAKGTPLHNGLNRMMTYGDFVAKAVLFDKLTKQDGMSGEAAMQYIQEEFINYDNNPGRTRTWFESHGFTWFLTYKLKIQKILLRRMRDNPLSTFVYQGAADGMGLDTPFEANLAGDNFWYSFSDPTRALDAMSLHPVAQLLR